MVTFVKDDQTPAITKAIHVAISTIIGCDSEILNFVIAAANQADLFAERRTQQIVPLIHKVNRRSNHERSTLHDFDDHLADVTFARTSGEDHHTTSPSSFP